MRRKCGENVTECQLHKLKTFEKHLELNLSEDKRVYEENLFVDGNFSKLQKYLSIRKTGTMSGEVYLDDQRATLIIDKAKLSNQYFQSVFNHSLYVGENNPSHESKTTNLHFTTTEIEKILENLDINIPKEPDNVGNFLLKKLSCSTSKSLCLLFNTIATKCVFLSTWKISEIVSTFKEVDKQFVSNYRPMSLLTDISKVLEKRIFDKMISSVKFCIQTHNTASDKNDLLLKTSLSISMRCILTMIVSKQVTWLAST